jgi:hypothetical protein
VLNRIYQRYLGELTVGRISTRDYPEGVWPLLAPKGPPRSADYCLFVADEPTYRGHHSTAVDDPDSDIRIPF